MDYSADFFGDVSKVIKKKLPNTCGESASMNASYFKIARYQGFWALGGWPTRRMSMMCWKVRPSKSYGHKL